MQNVDAITIKMFHTGSVGDCFLLQFKKNDVVTFKMLIDCGSYNGKKEDMDVAVNSLKREIGDNILDVAVVTHEHLDHISGFNQAKSIFDDIAFSNVWMSWAEGESAKAKKLKSELGKKIENAITRLKKQNAMTQHRMNNSTSPLFKLRLRRQVENYSSILEDLNFELSLTNANAMSYVKSKSANKVKYWEPGQIIENLKGAEGIKFYILGPPYDEDFSSIKDEEDHDEMYSLINHKMRIDDHPFFESNVKEVALFKEEFIATGGEANRIQKQYDSIAYKWRQIEEDQYDLAGDLAIALRDFINNTSLAFAIEFIASGKVLLFPADAQSGNWKSWHRKVITTKFKKNNSKSAKELLENTVFYKVGHHGSHNGTASASGLELMPDKDMVAMMPLVLDKIPSSWGGEDNFPAKALYEVLIKKTNGAIIRTDEGLIKDKRAVNLRNQNINETTLKNLNKNKKGNKIMEWTVNS